VKKYSANPWAVLLVVSLGFFTEPVNLNEAPAGGFY